MTQSDFILNVVKRSTFIGAAVKRRKGKEKERHLLRHSFNTWTPMRSSTHVLKVDLVPVPEFIWSQWTAVLLRVCEMGFKRPQSFQVHLCSSNETHFHHITVQERFDCYRGFRLWKLTPRILLIFSYLTFYFPHIHNLKPSLWATGWGVLNPRSLQLGLSLISCRIHASIRRDGRCQWDRYAVVFRSCLLMLKAFFIMQDKSVSDRAHTHTKVHCGIPLGFWPETKCCWAESSGEICRHATSSFCRGLSSCRYWALLFWWQFFRFGYENEHQVPEF